MPSLSFSQTSWSIYSLSNSIHPKLYCGLGFHKFHINKSHDHEIMQQILIFIDFYKSRHNSLYDSLQSIELWNLILNHTLVSSGWMCNWMCHIFDLISRVVGLIKLNQKELEGKFLLWFWLGEYKWPLILNEQESSVGLKDDSLFWESVSKIFSLSIFPFSHMISLYL